MERLDRFLAAGGVESRRRVKEVVRSGRVCVNGAVISEPEFKVNPEKDVITLDGRRIGASSGRKVVMLHKPAGCITAARDEKERTVMECLPPEYRKLMPIGRLDKETEGLLRFTNDGDLAHRLLAPKSHVVKEYYAEHVGQATEEDVTAFAEGCVLRDGTKCLPAELIPLGAGKSTMAKRVAKELGYLYVDTGAIYRTVGYHMWLMGIGPKDADGIRRCLDDVNIEIRHEEDGVQHMILNGQDVTGEIRTPEMSRYASGVSAQKCVREYLLDMQRKFSRKHNVVMDGRDIGTVVLPNAQVKIFLTASPEERAKRRYEELTQKGEKVISYEKVLQDMIARDKQDSERAIAPLRPAPDAVKLDTSGNTIEQSIAEILAIVRRKLG